VAGHAALLFARDPVEETVSGFRHRRTGFVCLRFRLDAGRRGVFGDLGHAALKIPSGGCRDGLVEAGCCHSRPAARRPMLPRLDARATQTGDRLRAAFGECCRKRRGRQSLPVRGGVLQPCLGLGDGPGEKKVRDARHQLPQPMQPIASDDGQIPAAPRLVSAPGPDRMAVPPAAVVRRSRTH